MHTPKPSSCSRCARRGRSSLAAADVVINPHAAWPSSAAPGAHAAHAGAPAPGSPGTGPDHQQQHHHHAGSRARAPAPVQPAPAPAPATTNTTVVTPASMAQPEPSVSGSYETNYINTPVFSTGATVFAISYGAGVISAASTDTKSNDRLYVPLVGPWLALHDRVHDNNCGALSNSRCDTNTTAEVLLVVDGVFQAAGLLAMVDGVFDPGSHEVSATVASNKKVHITPAPVGANADPGIWAMGRF